MPQLVFVGAEDGSDAERGLQRAARVVLMGDRGTEERHDAVAEKLIHGALVAVDFGQHELEGPRHEAVDVLRIEAFGEGGEA